MILILDLSNLNKQIVKVHFGKEDSYTIKCLIKKNDFMVSIDLAKAFFSILLHKDSRDFTTFQYKQCRYSHNVLPFGLTSSPRIFSKMLKLAIVHIQSQGIKISFYLDDIFKCSSCSDTLRSHLNLTMSILTSLGFTINIEKSSLIPS